MRIADLSSSCFCRFQLVGICCLRVAMLKAPHKLKDEQLEATRFSSITADCYTPEQVIYAPASCRECLALCV
jgi:hypothetical protein